MTQNEIMKMAREAGLHIATDVNWMPIIGLEYAEKFAALVIANHPPQSFMSWQEGYEAGKQTEREACEALHDHEDVQAPIGNSSWGEAYQEGWGQGTAAYLEAIRARGQA
jgi:hypothetical protein